MNRADFEIMISENVFTPIHQVVYEYLLNQIVTMELEPNARVHESEISNTLGISRTPVRTAINNLLGDGLIRMDPDKRILEIAPLSSEEYAMISEVRQMLEGQAAYYAAIRITKEEKLELKRLISLYEEAFSTETVENYEILEHEFHSFIIKASHNSYLIEMYESIQHRLLRYRYYVRHYWGTGFLRKELSHNIRWHKTICSAILRGYSAVAKHEAENHITQMLLLLSKPI